MLRSNEDLDVLLNVIDLLRKRKSSENFWRDALFLSTRFTDQTVSSKIEQNSLHKSQRNFELILFRKNTLQIGGSGQSALISLKRIQSKYGNFHEKALWGNIFSVRVNYFIINSIFFKISKIYLKVKFLYVNSR